VTRTTCWFESLAPSWLVHDGGYRAALTRHLRDRVERQGYEIVAPIHIRVTAGEVPPPVGMVMVSVETQVEEFDVDMGGPAGEG
jgi:hypothetical protein